MIITPSSPLFPTNFTRFTYDEEEKLAPTNTHPPMMAPSTANFTRFSYDEEKLATNAYPAEAPMMAPTANLARSYDGDENLVAPTRTYPVAVSMVAPTVNLARVSDDKEKLAPTAEDVRMWAECTRCTRPYDSPLAQQQRSSMNHHTSLASTMALIEQQVRLNAIAAAALSEAAPTDWLSSQLVAASNEQSLRRNSNMNVPQIFQQQQQQQLLAPVAPVSSGRRVEESEIRDMDVLCGRGGKSNNHPGNKHYRQVVGEMREQYRELTGKKQKTGLGYAIVDYVEAQGGRFLKRNGKNTYTVLNKSQARRKASQALRETKELKWIY